MDVEEAIINRRTIRRYKQEEIPIDILKKLINSGRLAPAGMN
ncbi:MAG: nitroreductase family protein, partial [Promethearchaeota archaeon]